MDLDKDDLAVLCAGMTKDEVDRVHRLLHEWNTGPEDSFPVQLTLLTVAQFRVAASVPRSITDSRKLIEQDLARYRKETSASVAELADMAQKQAHEMKQILAAHQKIVTEATASIRYNASETEHWVIQLQAKMRVGAAKFEEAKDSLVNETLRFQKVCDGLDTRIAWRNLLWSAVAMVSALGVGIGIGYYLHP